jgi:hypothetical protein
MTCEYQSTTTAGIIIAATVAVLGVPSAPIITYSGYTDNKNLILLTNQTNPAPVNETITFTESDAITLGRDSNSKTFLLHKSERRKAIANHENFIATWG